MAKRPKLYGGIVNSPKGWEPGEPVYSAEGCYYPTWKRKEPTIAKKKMQTFKCCPDECPEVGDKFECAEGCGFAITVTGACECPDAKSVALGCCGKPLVKLT